MMTMSNNHATADGLSASCWRYLPIAGIVLLYLVISSLYFDMIPLWDERFYYEDFILSAEHTPFDALSYSGNHNAQLWLYLMAIPNYFFPHDYHEFREWAAVLSATGVVAFYLVIGELLGAKISLIERCLLTALFAFHPSVLANHLNITLDTGLMIFWLWYLWALLKDKVILATIIGCFMVFTKEQGMAYLGILYVFCMLRNPPGARMKWAISRIFIPAIPLGAMGVFLAYKALLRNGMFFYGGFLQNDSPTIRIMPDETLVNFFLMGFVLNFQWLVVALISGLAVWARYLPREQRPWVAMRPDMQAIGLLVLATTAIVLGVRHWACVRYLLPLFPSLLLCFSYFFTVISPPRIRVGLLCTLLVLLGWQNVRSIDPVSNAVFCYVQFGEHELVYMPPMQEICLFHRGPLRLLSTEVVYNLEFTHVPALIRKIMEDIKPTNDTLILVDTYYNDGLLTGSQDRNHIWLDKDYHQTLGAPAFTPQVRNIFVTFLWNGAAAFAQGLPDSFYFIEFPAPENNDYRKFFASYFEATDEKAYDVDGYQAHVIHLTKYKSTTP